MPTIFNSSVLDELPNNRTSFSGADIRAVVYRPVYNTSSGDRGSFEQYYNSGGLYHELGAIQTLSVSSFREKYAVRSFGFQGVMSYTRGNRTIAGSLVFALIQRHPFNETGTTVNDFDVGILRSSSGMIGPVEQITDRFGPSEDFPNLPEDPNITNVDKHRKHQYDFTWDSQLFGTMMYPDELPPFDVIITFANEAGNIGKIVLHGVDLHEEGMTLSIEDLFTEVTYSYTARALTLFEEGSFQGRLWRSGSVNAYAQDYALRMLNG